MKRTVVVVGATQGLGLGLAETYLANGWRVIATTLGESAALNGLHDRYPEALTVRPLDITDRQGVAALRDSLDGERVDVLHIVAGVYQKTFDPIWDQPDEEILRLLQTNAISGVRMAEVFDPLVPPGGVFAFTSSGMGSLTRNTRGGVDPYRISKVVLNMLVRSLAGQHADSGRAYLLLCPGWAKTQMGGADATVEVSDSVQGMYRLVVEAKPGPVATFRDYTGDVVPW